MLLLLILCALRSGSDRYYFLKTQQSDVRAKEVLYFLRPSRLFSALVFYLNYYLRKLLYVVICFIPCVAFVVMFFYYAEHGRASFAVAIVILAAAVIFIVNGIIYFYRFNSLLFASRYYFASGEFSSYRQLFYYSARCLDGRRGVIVKERLRLSGWFLSCILVFPVPFVQNYYRETMARLAIALMKNQYLQNG